MKSGIKQSICKGTKIPINTQIDERLKMELILNEIQGENSPQHVASIIRGLFPKVTETEAIALCLNIRQANHVDK